MALSGLPSGKSTLCIYSAQYSLISKQYWKFAHSILGTIVVGLFIIPLILGYMQHDYYEAHQKRSWRGIYHFWTARILILLGIIDGYVSFGPNLIYATIGGLVIIFYLVTLFILGWREKRNVHAVRDATIEVE
jgi:hypothetical protein